MLSPISPMTIHRSNLTIYIYVLYVTKIAERWESRSPFSSVITRQPFHAFHTENRRISFIFSCFVGERITNSVLSPLSISLWIRSQNRCGHPLQLNEVTHANQFAKENPRCITFTITRSFRSGVTCIRTANAVDVDTMEVENIHLCADKTFICSAFKFNADVWRWFFFLFPFVHIFGNGICTVFWSSILILKQHSTKEIVDSCKMVPRLVTNWNR